MIFTESEKNIPPQEEVVYPLTWKYSKLLGGEKLITTNLSSSAKIQWSQLKISFDSLEYCGDPQKPFFCLTYHPVESPVQFCSVFSSRWGSRFPLTHQRATIVVKVLEKSATHSDIREYVLFHVFLMLGYSSSKRLTRNRGALEAYQGQFKELCVEQEGVPVQSHSLASAREEQIQKRRGHFTYL